MARSKALAGLPVRLPVAEALAASIVMGVAVPSGVAAAVLPVVFPMVIRSLVSRVATHPEASRVAIPLVEAVSTEAAEATDKNNGKEPKKRIIRSSFFIFSLFPIIFRRHRRVLSLPYSSLLSFMEGEIGAVRHSLFLSR